MLTGTPGAGHEDRPFGAPADQGVVDELPAVVTIQAEHRIRQPAGDLSIAATTLVRARLRIATFSVQPRYTSVMVNVHAYSPLRVCPQCATRSIPKNPGACSISSIAWRTPIEDRSVPPGRVADFAAGYRQPWWA